MRQLCQIYQKLLWPFLLPQKLVQFGLPVLLILDLRQLLIDSNKSRPKVLIVSDCYFYNNKTINTLSKVKEILKAITSIETVVVIPFYEKKYIKNQNLYMRAGHLLCIILMSLLKKKFLNLIFLSIYCILVEPQAPQMYCSWCGRLVITTQKRTHVAL